LTRAQDKSDRIIAKHQATITTLQQDLLDLWAQAQAPQKNYAKDTAQWSAVATSSSAKLRDARGAVEQSQQTVHVLRAFVEANAGKLRG
jgi:hypothetical protein